MLSWMKAALIHLRLMKNITISSSEIIHLITFVGFIWSACLMNPASAQSAEPIKIGAVLPFSGGVELYGAQAKLGIDLAVKEINAGGGVLGGGATGAGAEAASA